MDRKELIRDMLHNFINDNKEAASTALHNILTLKSREITGITPSAPSQTASGNQQDDPDDNKSE